MPAEERRERLLAATRALLAEAGGASAVRLDAVAARAGTTKATLYRYFPSKAALLAAASDGRATDDGIARRDQILDAAMAIIARHGLHSTSMDRIATAAGVSAPALYWHFKNKDDLLLAVVERLADGLDLDAVTAEAARLAPDEALPRLIEAALEFQGPRIGLMRVLLAEAGTRPALAAALYERVASRVWGRLTAYLEAEAAAGRLEPGDALLRTLALVGMVTYYGLARQTFGDRLAIPPPYAAAAELSRLYLHGVLGAGNTRRGGQAADERPATP